MEIYTCRQCRYTFRRPLLPASCPDCGTGTVRKATVREIREYDRIQRLLAEDIRMGLWEGTPCVQT